MNFSRPLQAGASRVDFQFGETIGPATQEFLGEFGDNWIYLPGFDEAQDFPGLPWRYIDIGTNTPPSFTKTLRSRTEFIVGFRFLRESEQHCGWMRFTRPDTHFLTFFGLDDLGLETADAPAQDRHDGRVGGAGEGQAGGVGGLGADVERAGGELGLGHVEAPRLVLVEPMG